MALWGIAYAAGPNYNKQWGDFDDDEKSACLEAANGLVARADSHRDSASDLEKSLIDALMVRYPDRSSRIRYPTPRTVSM